jgi:hypothetical protein
MTRDRPVKRLAIYNFNNFRAPSADPANAGFHERNDPNFAAAERSDGFVARSGYDGDPGPASWGEQVYPRFYLENGDASAPSTLSLWRDLASLYAFVHSDIHREAMRHARQSFDPHRWPPYVLWWVEENHVPKWSEGVKRLELLHDMGPSPEAFDFRNPFDTDGRPMEFDRRSMRTSRSGDAGHL